MHISKILYHWRVHKSSTANVADSKPYAYEAGMLAAKAHIERTGRNGKVTDGQDVPGIYKIQYDIKGNPKVSILIPNKDNIDLLKKCINSILKLTTYSNYEIIIIENNSEEKETFYYYNELVKNAKIKILNFNQNTILDSNGEKQLENIIDKGDNSVTSNLEKMSNKFNYSALINFGVKNCSGEFILQLNNDTQLLTQNWLELMIGYAQNKEIGAIGARLYYEDKTIQHAGIIVGLSGIAGNMLVNLPYGKHAYFGREAATRNVSAVTGACLFCRRELYQEVGYMDENDFKVAFNDVDFCLKVRKTGKLVVYNAHSMWHHYESKSRGYEDTPEKIARFNREIATFAKKWPDILANGDPYYNPNLTLRKSNFALRDLKKEKIGEPYKLEVSLED